MTGPNLDMLIDRAPSRDWTDLAACRSHPHDWWHPEPRPDSRGQTSREQYEQARAVCRLCPVRDECLDHALAHGEAFGMWGGMTPRERSNERRRREQPRWRHGGLTSRPDPLATRLEAHR